MSRTHLIVLLFWAVTTVLWAMSVWGPWAARLYDRVGPDSIGWYWLRVFDVPRTRENCIRFVRVLSLVGIVMVTAVVTIVFVTQP